MPSNPQPDPHTVHAVPIAQARNARLRLLAALLVALMLLVTGASAWLRLAQPRAACAGWPDCRDSARPALDVRAPAWLGDASTVAKVRATHRVVATLALLLIVALCVAAHRARELRARRTALALLALALGLSLLGIVTPGSRSHAVLLGNLLGGLAMLALAWRLRRGLAARPAARLSRATVVAAGLGLALVATQAALGALSGAGAGRAYALAHLALAVALLPLLLAAGWLARRDGARAEGSALLALAAGQFLLGLYGAGAGAAPAWVLAHNTGAALALALLAGWAGWAGRAPLPLANPNPNPNPGASMRPADA